MTFGEKISKLRKESNYTQEQLADILGVSRQSVSKWESDIAYPETDKLIQIGKLFSCSMDYLLKDEVTERENPAKSQSDTSGEKILIWLKHCLRERKSQKTVFGMPLYHIGRDAKGFFAIGIKAKGVFTVGLRSCGVFSLGLLSFGVMSAGLLSSGLIALGTFALGVLSAGCIAAGLLSLGAISIGVVSIGALSVGLFSSGALAIGKYIAIGDNARAMIALGESAAIGSEHGYIGDISEADIEYIRSYLDNITPQYLAWAKELFKLLL